MRLEATTGLTHLAFQQDFAAKIVADNLHTLLTALPPTADASDADAPLTEPTSRTNRTYAIGALRPMLTGCLLRVNACLDALTSAVDVIARTHCRIQSGRSYPRPPRTKPHSHSAYKLCC